VQETGETSKQNWVKQSMSELKVSAHLQSNYKDYYKEPDSEWRSLGAIDKAHNIQTLCNDLQINSVIEIGAGEGAILQQLSALDFAKDLYALEISPTGVTAIKNRNIPCLKECVLFDGYNIPYGKTRFDLAVLSHVVEHIEYPRKLLYEAKRIARYVFVEVPLEDTVRLSRDFRFDKVGHINFYSPKTIRRLIQSCDLKVLNQKTTNLPKDGYVFRHGKKGLINYYIKEYLLKFFPRLATEIFTYHSSIICEDNVEG
jgi:SAM-dependent methyltransferase